MALSDSGLLSVHEGNGERTTMCDQLWYNEAVVCKFHSAVCNYCDCTLVITQAVLPTSSACATRIPGQLLETFGADEGGPGGVRKEDRLIVESSSAFVSFRSKFGFNLPDL